jgi:hypothetical protein
MLQVILGRNLTLFRIVQIFIRIVSYILIEIVKKKIDSQPFYEVKPQRI